MAGYRLPLAAHLLVIAINEALGAVNHTVEYRQSAAVQGWEHGRLGCALNAGQVQTLVILGGNPVYNAPADLNWRAAQAKAKTVVRLGYYKDETSWNPDFAPRHPMGLADGPLSGILGRRPHGGWNALCRFSR